MGCTGPLVSPRRTLNDWESATLAAASVLQTMTAARSLVMAAAQTIGAATACQTARERIRNPSRTLSTPRDCTTPGRRRRAGVSWTLHGLRQLEPLALHHLLVELDAVDDRGLV